MVFRSLLLFAWILATFATVHAKEAVVAPRIAANNAVKIKSMVGKTATVHGKVKSSSVSKGGLHFLNFYSSDLVVVCFKDNVPKFGKGGPAKLFKDKEIEVTGKIELYKRKPQIKIASPGQVKLSRANGKLATDRGAGNASGKTPSLADVRVDNPAAKSESKTPSLADVKVGNGSASSSSSNSKKFELKQTGKLKWVSPAGLIYSGKDPQGRTRVEHVLRHAADEPRRAGSHGVFDGGNDKALATVDEAWRLAKKNKIKPKNEGRTSAYTIPMGRRVGYLGGQSGKKRGKPALKKVFIVVRTNTSEVITAFPR